jgi:glutamate carboxypeptidase
MTRPLHEYCDRHQRWMMRLVEALVEVESPSDDKAAVDRCGALLANRLQEVGGEIARVSSATAGDHLRVSFGSGSRQVLLLGHFDTVWPVGQLEKMPIRREGGRLHGPGIFDMKAGIGLGALATRAVLEVAAPAQHRIVMLWTTDEEVGSRTSRALIEAEARQSDAVLVLEPSLPGGVLKTSRKGVGQYEIVVSGVAAHSGVDPGKGVSAIRELARQLLAIESLQDLDRGISVNVGIVSGGSRANVVADRARAIVDARAETMADAAALDARMRALAPQLAGASLQIEGGFERPPMERTAGVARLFDIARQVGAELGLDVKEGGTGGGSDGNFTAALGVPTLDGLGAVGDGAHALHEHVDIEAMVPRAALIAGILQRIANG